MSDEQKFSEIGPPVHLMVLRFGIAAGLIVFVAEIVLIFNLSLSGAVLVGVSCIPAIGLIGIEVALNWSEKKDRRIVVDRSLARVRSRISMLPQLPKEVMADVWNRVRQREYDDKPGDDLREMAYILIFSLRELLNDEQKRILHALLEGVGFGRIEPDPSGADPRFIFLSTLEYYLAVLTDTKYEAHSGSSEFKQKHRTR